MRTRYLFKISVLCAALLTMAGCTQNTRAKNFGGTAHIDLAPGQQLVNITFKETNIWVDTKPRPTGQLPETHTFREYSDLGLVEGTVIIQER